MSRYIVLLCLAFASVMQLSCGAEVKITTDDKLCLYANLMGNFSVSYEAADHKTQTAVFELPKEVTSEDSVCQKTISTLKLNFGEGHSLSVIFSVTENGYQAILVTFTYNLGDKTLFKDSVSNEIQTASAVPQMPIVELDSGYSCKSKLPIHISPKVNVTVWNVLLQAFVSNGRKSERTISCAADVARDSVPPPTDTSASTSAIAKKTTTTPPPTHTTTTSAPSPTSHITTVAPTSSHAITKTTTVPTTTVTTTTSNATTSNVTTAPPTTSNATTSNVTTAPPTTSNATTSNVTTAPPTTSNATTPNATTATPTTPTPTPTPTLPTPSTGKFVIKPVNSTEACLLADFGLRVGYEHKGKYENQNFNPNNVSISGLCGVNSSELHLVSDSISFLFTFSNDTKKFYLHALNITVKTSSGEIISEGNKSLNLWEASVGSSYMCNKEQNFTLNSRITLFTFQLHVQPFGVNKGVFSTAHECSLDDTSVLIPIIVGAALAGLILIVVIAYVIGRRKTYVGYQTL